MSSIRHLPTLGVVSALATFVVAAQRYPGGTHLATDTVGFSWRDNFLCSLFASQGLNGADNGARPLAVGALLLLCVSLGVLSFAISRSTTSRRHRSLIEIGGIGTAVYSMFVVTPLHNLVINIGFVFGLVAFVSLGHLMWQERRPGLLWWGVAVLVLKSATAVSYYGNVCYEWLPLLQKVGIVVGLGWVLGVYYRDRVQVVARPDNLPSSAKT